MDAPAAPLVPIVPFDGKPDVTVVLKERGSCLLINAKMAGPVGNWRS